MKNEIIRIHDLSKSYGKLQAVKNISLNVYEGELFAFLGPNGAGKSTTINILSTLLEKDAGEIEINQHSLGKDNDKIRNDIGIVFQKSFLDDLLTVKENLFTRASFYGLEKSVITKRINTLSEQLSLHEFIDRPYGKLSGGQRRRADIARALVNHPKILFLDEPTTGLDPQTRHSIWTYIEDLRIKHKMTIFLTTHYMEEAAKCDRVCIIDHGEILELKTPRELRVQYAPTLMRIKTDSLDESSIQKFNVPFQKINDGYEIVLKESKEAYPILDTYRNQIEQFEVVEGTMDTVFLALTGKTIREDES
ncbi:MAG: ABC transporter ATP-binding protein [Erysipelotrichaceae bacterium]